MAGGFRQEETELLRLSDPSPLPSSDVVVAAAKRHGARYEATSFGTAHSLSAGSSGCMNLLDEPARWVARTPTLALPSWLPSRPVPIETVMLERVPQPPRPHSRPYAPAR